MERPTGHSSVEVGHPGPDMSASDYFVSSIFGRSKIIGGMASNDIAAIASIVVSIPVSYTHLTLPTNRDV